PARPGPARRGGVPRRAGCTGRRVEGGRQLPPPHMIRLIPAPPTGLDLVGAPSIVTWHQGRKRYSDATAGKICRGRSSWSRQTATARQSAGVVHPQRSRRFAHRRGSRGVLGGASAGVGGAGGVWGVGGRRA